MRYIILHGPIFSDRDWDRFGCGHFASRGYTVEPYELTEVIWSGASTKVSSENYHSSQKAIAVTRLEQVRELIAGIGADDFVLCNLIVGPETVAIFRLLTEFQVDYAVATLGEVPTTEFRGSAARFGIATWLRMNISDLMGRAYRLKIILKQVFDPKINLLSLRRPRWWIRAGTGHPYFVATYPKCWLSERIETHSFDYERIIMHRDAAKAAASGEGQPFAVFVDEAYVDHPDFAYVNEQSPVTFATYKRFIDRLFDRVETELGMPVKVAAHPRSRPDTGHRLYDRWAVHHGETAELIAAADLVILTCSTAISFAAYFRRPVLFVTTDEISRDPYFGPFTERMSSWFDMPPVNLDRLAESEPLALPRIPAECYLEYEHAFMRGPTADDRPIWETVADRVQASGAVARPSAPRSAANPHDGLARSVEGK